MKDLSWINSRPPFEKEKFLNGPAMKPPPNTLPKFENPPNKSSVGIGLCIYAGVVSTLLVLLRVYSRGVYHRRLNVEDCKLTKTDQHHPTPLTSTSARRRSVGKIILLEIYMETLNRDRPSLGAVSSAPGKSQSILVSSYINGMYE